MKEKPQFSIQARLCKVFWRALLECQMGTALKIFGQKRLRIIIIPSRRFRSLHMYDRAVHDDQGFFADPIFFDRTRRIGRFSVRSFDQK